MKNEKIKIEFEIDVTEDHTQIKVSHTKGGKEMDDCEVSVKELAAMWVAVRSLKDEIEENGREYGIDFTKIEKRLMNGNDSKKGIMDRMLDWVNGN